jgi:acyl-CoA synthetase (NDP forming)/GNAT superfamily N-acetyltransferase
MTTSAPPSYALLADGSTIAIRVARPDDYADVREMHEQMSPDNSYLRFFSLSRLASEREAQRLCRPESPDHAALLARRDGRLVGVASYELTKRPGVAEIAFAVPDDMHGRGVATLLLEHLVSLARQRGLTAFSGETLVENTPMQRVLADAGLPVERHTSDGVVEVTIPLPSHDGTQLDRYLDAVAARASRADVASLTHLLRPASVAVIGAGRRRGSVGREILHNIVAGGFDESVYAINRLGRSMEGLACLASADDLPAGTELAVIAVPPDQVPKVATQCGRRGVRALVVVTSGLGARGADLLSICRRYGMRLVGPNCLGLATSTPRLNATFAARVPLGGTAGVVVQSGGVGVALLEHLGRLGIGVSSFASVGDKYDVSSNDLLTWWEQDGQTKQAILFVESFGSPRAFARTARRVGRTLPVLTVVSGRSAAGQRAASSSGRSAPPPVTREALFRQAGIIVCCGLGELVDTAAFLACQPHPAGRRVAIVSNAGGATVLAADVCDDCGLVVATLGSATLRRLARLLPPDAALAGPVNTGAAVSAATFRACLETVAADDGVDAVLALAVPTAVADLAFAITTAEVAKPIAAALLGQPESVRLLAARAGLDSDRSAGPSDAWSVGASSPRMAAYSYPENAVRALAHAADYEEWCTAQHGQVPEFDDVDPAGARAIAAEFLAANPVGGWLPGADAAALMACYGIPMVATEPVTDARAAAAAAARLGGRVVLKAEAAGVPHETQPGAVRLDLRTNEEVTEAYTELAGRFGDRLQRVLVQPMLSGGIATIVGVVEEPVFGPLVVFGLGKEATEALADRSARLTPLTDVDAAAMIADLRAAPLLTGRAGPPAVDTAGLAQLLLRVSRLADDLPEVVELDLDPVIARPDGVYPTDVRARLAPAAPHDPFLRQLR